MHLTASRAFSDVLTRDRFTGVNAKKVFRFAGLSSLARLLNLVGRKSVVPYMEFESGVLAVNY